MDVVKQKPLLLLVFIAFVLKIARSGFNAVYLKQTKANYTCGSPPEEFFETQQGFLSAVDRVPFICNASDPARAYPPENMVDGLLGTHWQSKAGEDMASITISFGQAFFAQNINITFGNYRRPGAIMVERSTDYGATFTPWHYLVTSPASRECRAKFGVQAFQGVIVRVDQVLCMEYSRYVPPEYNETMFIELNQKQRGDGSPDPYTPGLQSWMNATAVRFSFSGLYRKFDSMATKWHHYTVREIVVTGRCDCKGHGDGNHCPFNQSTGLRACQCEGNTCGVQCDQCCLLYNQFPWKPGSGAPWTNDAAAKCEACNCHNHADTCMFNQTVSDLGLSMSINGSMIGGGVCLNCQHETEGLNCEKCKDYFYRPVGKNKSDADACQACLCNLNGTTNVTGLSFGDCIKDENALSVHPGKQPGDCYCKAFVQGRQCDTCKAGFYRLTQENPQGCIACNCHLDGTIGRSSVCQGDYHGQCNCKTNVVLRDCSQCKDGYYDLQDSDSNGCKFCDCDVGGTKSGQTCDKVTGVCHCQSHVIGRTCNRTESGFYYPDAHFIHAERNPYEQSVTYALHVMLDIPKTGKYRLLVKYTNEGQEVQTQAVIQYNNISASQAEELFNFSLPLQECANCPATIGTNNPKDYLLLKKDTGLSILLHMSLSNN